MTLRERYREVLKQFAKYSFDEGARCVKDNIEPNTCQWIMAKKIVDMTEKLDQTLDELLECLPSEEEIHHILCGPDSPDSIDDCKQANKLAKVILNRIKEGKCY